MRVIGPVNAFLIFFHNNPVTLGYVASAGMGGFEPPTDALTVRYSAVELHANSIKLYRGC